MQGHRTVLAPRFLAFWASAAVALAAASSCQCGTAVGSAGKTTLTITSPVAGAFYGEGDSFSFLATALNPGGIESVALFVGPVGNVSCDRDSGCLTGQICDAARSCVQPPIKTCDAPKGTVSVTCEQTVAVADLSGLIVEGQVQLTALAIDHAKAPTQQTVTINLKPGGITFTAPALTPGTIPIVAEVAGISPVAVSIVSAIPMATVTITADGTIPLASWTSPMNGALQQSVNWETQLGVGLHHLLANATDVDGNVDTAQLAVMVERPQISFTQPVIPVGANPAVAPVAGTTPVAVDVTSVLPLTSVVITHDSGEMLAEWSNASGPTFQQMVDWQSDLGLGPHTLTAVATDTAGETATATIQVDVELPTITFTAPMITTGTSIATVVAPSPVAVAMTSALPIASVVITFDADLPLAQWTSPTGLTLQQTVDWGISLGMGLHTLKSVLTDSQGETATATLQVNVEVPTISFTQPMALTGSSPSLAVVEGSSPVAVQTSSPLPVVSVVITHDGGLPLASWMNPTSSNLLETVNWATTLGTGTHVLTATLTDTMGDTATATLSVELQSLGIVFTQPTLPPGVTPAVAQLDPPSPVAVTVSSLLPLSSVVITFDNGRPLASWITNPIGPIFQQTISWGAALGAGAHQLTAVATDVQGGTATATLAVEVQVLTISFTAPTITSPGLADVGGTTPLAVAVSSALPLQAVTVTYDAGTLLAQWTGNGPTFQQSVPWATTLGNGSHTLTAIVTDSLGNTATATLTVVVQSLGIVFTEPTLTAGTNPPAANVIGSSTMALNVTSLLPLNSVVVTYDANLPLANWGASPTPPAGGTWATPPRRPLRSARRTIPADSPTSRSSSAVRRPTLTAASAAVRCRRPPSRWRPFPDQSHRTAAPSRT
jgi:hypothetical protein